MTTRNRIRVFERIWRRRFGVLITVIGLIIVALLGIVIVGLAPEGTFPESVESFRNFLASPNFPAVLGTVELVLLLAAFALTAFHFRHTRAAEFIERFNSPEVMAMRGRVDDWLGDYASSELRMRVRERGEEVEIGERLRLLHFEARLLLELKRRPELDKSVKAFANLFQEVGEAYDNRTVSPSYTRRMFDVMAPRYWQLLQFWVEAYREEVDPTLYSRFGHLAEILAKRADDLAQAQQAEESEASSDVNRLALRRRTMLTEATRPHRSFVFGYGSLISQRSRQHASGDAGVRNAALHGWTRAWNVVDHIEMEGDERPRPALFLGLALAIDGACNGVLIEVDDDELSSMDVREQSYLRLDVTRWIDWGEAGPVANAVVYTYVGLPESSYDAERDAQRWPGLIVLGRYVRLVEEGLAGCDEAFVAEYRRHTWPIPSAVPTDDRPYRFLSAEQNRATGREQLAEDGGPARESLENAP